jgi:hypothetical protein
VPATERDDMATATTEPVRLPPGPRIPKTVQGIAFLTALCEVVPALGRRYGGTYTTNLAIVAWHGAVNGPQMDPFDRRPDQDGQTWRQHLRDRIQVPSVGTGTRSKPRR